MKILHVTDLHTAWHWLDWLAKAPHYDLIVISGDIQLDEDNQDLVAQHDKIQQWAALLKDRKIIFCSGNHDTSQMVDTLSLQGFYVDGFSGPVNDFWLTVAPFRWNNDKDLNQKAFKLIQSSQEKKGKLPWILVTHRPPVGLLGQDSFCGADDGLGRWMENHPIRYVFSGHCHKEPLMANTCFEKIGLGCAFNPGRSHSAKYNIPNHIVFDTKTDSGIWFDRNKEKPFKIHE